MSSKQSHFWVWGLSLVTGGLAALAWLKWPKHDKAGIPVSVDFPQATKVQQDVEPVVQAAVQVANQALTHPAVANGSHPNAAQAQAVANQAIATANQALGSPQGAALANQAQATAQQAAKLLGFPVQGATAPFDPYAVRE